MYKLNLSVILLLFCLVHLSNSLCPRLCECKWKSGKESVICLNANLSFIPLHLDAGTQALDLTGNNLPTIGHEEFSRAGLVNLQKVYMSRCRLKTIERYAFQDLINLVELDLSYNFLNAVPSQSFDSITELRELKLNGNPIHRVAANAFVHLSQLVRLDMSECRISHIEPKAFKGLERSIERLKLDENKLSEVEASSFTVLQKLKALELAGNPWNCSCRLRPLREWMLLYNVPSDFTPNCHYPKRLEMKSWDKLDLDEFACIPEIIAYESKAHGIEGKNVTMTCRIAGIPEPNVRWLIKNKVIANLTASTQSGSKKLYIMHLTNNSSELTIFSADLQDAGTYVCAAENKAGKAEASVTLAVSKKLPESGLSSKVLLASVITGITFVIISCFITICVCSARKNQVLKWRDTECISEENYEKIELNHKAVKANGGVTVNQVESDMSFNRKNGEYKVVSAGDTDHECEEDEENDGNGTKKWSNTEKTADKAWNSPEHLLDPEDLHIPRRTIQETRDNITKNFSATCGTYNEFSPSSTNSSTPLHSSYPVRYPPTSSYYVSTCNKELSRVVEDNGERQFPDLIESSPVSKVFDNNAETNHRYFEKLCSSTTSRAVSENGSVSDINEIFCTLPRKKELMHSSRYRSSDSQSPLLAESRYGSSGGESYLGSQDNGHRRMSDSQKYPLPTNLNRNRVNKISNSYLNLTREENLSPKESLKEIRANPLLNVSNLENRIQHNGRDVVLPTQSMKIDDDESYDYHAAQLERFLEEYRLLQKELTKMKETCATLCQEKDQVQVTPVTPLTPSSGSSKLVSSNKNLAISPSSNVSLEESEDFRNFENELTKYLVSRNISSSNFQTDV